MKHAKLVSKAIEIQRKIDKLKELYSELDVVTEALQSSKFKSLSTKTHDVFIVDNFSKKNVAFRTTSIRRFELRIERKVK